MLCAGSRRLARSSGGKFEKLSGNWAGQYSIRVNQQWRLCFVWKNGEAREVEFCDYHCVSIDTERDYEGRGFSSPWGSGNTASRRRLVSLNQRFLKS
ncbi:type II toxin-antitoxin system RelE/ParE family toxin [Collinsella intestinalis]|uniref:type II toxin-antitoxin system RelE/ParE family toxin n=1 Tax=Collinsella intestinalis TaxID=147207 RepID=UPI00195B7B5D